MGEEEDSEASESLRIKKVASFSIFPQDPVIATLRFWTVFDAKTLSQHQTDDLELKTILENPIHPLKLQKFTWNSGDDFWWHFSTTGFLVLVPQPL